MNSFRSLKKEVFAPSPPHYLVGWKGYPQVSIGPTLSLSGIEEGSFDMGLDDFVAVRANQLRTYQKKPVRAVDETALSIKPVDFDVKLKRVPNQLRPEGLTAIASSITPGETKVPGKVYSVIDSFDLKASQALMKLENYGFDYLVGALSTGNLGVKNQRKLVPTRWAITAVDSTLSKDLFLKIRGEKQVSDYELYKISHWDNHFWIVLAPWAWSFEMLEQWHKNPVISDYEYGRPKKDYADNITGAYYAARLEILRHLADRKRQAMAFVIRRIGGKYIYLVGVWHIREAVKRGLQNKPEKFSSLSSLEEKLRTELNWPEWKKKSSLWVYLSRQKKLNDYFQV